MRNTNAEKLLQEAWNRHLDNYDDLVNLYKNQGYTIKRNDESGSHIVTKKDNSIFEDIFGNIFNGGKV